MLNEKLGTCLKNNILLQTFDFESLQFIAEHPKTNGKSAYMFIEVLSKAYLDQPSSANAIKGPLLSLVDRFIESNQISKWLQDTIESMLSRYLGHVDPKLAFIKKDSLNELVPPGSRASYDGGLLSQLTSEY